MISVVLDTNIVLASITSTSPFHFIIECLSEHKFQLFITNDILLEYEEKLLAKFDASTAEFFISSLLQNTSVDKVDVFFNLNLIDADKDDNKFVDAAFCANVNYLVTNDKHFNILKQVSFPSIAILNIQDFITILRQTT